ncbi:MAG: ATP-binding protein [Desulfitobacterium hafniense]|nr:ATP-binding protein [Desulfitobacterium hafniense]
MKKSSIPWWMRIKIHVLLFGVAMSILPLFFLGYLSFSAVRQHLEKNIHEQNYERVTVLANEMREFVLNTENSLIHLTAANAVSLVGKDETSRKIILGTLLRQETFVEEIKVADKDFNLLDHVARRDVVLPHLEITKIENPVAFDQTLAMSQVFFSNDRRPQFYLTVAVQDPIIRERIGYLQAKVDLKGIISKFVNLGLGQTGYVYLVDQSGNLIGHTDFSRVLRQEEVRQNPAVQSFIEGKASSTESEHVNVDGVKVIGSFATVGTPNWAVFVEQPISEAYKPIYEFSIRLLMIAIMIMVIVTILSIAFGLKLVHPVENLEGQVRRIISTGDLESHIPIESWDEIGRLVQSFNQLLNLLDEKNENLKDEKELLTTVVDGIGAGMVLLNSEKKIIWWNTKFAEWFGNELVNLPYEQVFKDENMEGFRLENGRIISVSVAGERRNIRQMYYELTPDNPENAAYLLLLADVTQEVELEARMIETDKMAALGLLASGVAHEINNPLAIAAAHSEDLLDRLDEEEPGPSQGEIKKGFKIVLEQIVRCKQITARLLGFARKRTTGPDLVDIGVASLQTLGLLGHREKQQNIKIESHLEHGLFVSGNENEWQQVVLNILTNAFDASAEGGVIEVKGWREGEEILFTVRDYGQGISQKYLKKVFDPFFTTKPSGQGTGLGLFVSYGIVQKMQGKLALESIEGQGTIVKITLPSHKAGD